MDDAAERYLPAPRDCPTFTDDTEWHPLVDGAAYLGALADLFQRASAGDTVLIAGLELDPDIDLRGERRGTPGHLPLGIQLAHLAARGVDVRVLLAGRVLASSLPLTGLGPFRANALRVARLRALRIENCTAPPLERRVLLDFAGPLLGSNHQKAVCTHINGELTSFVTGIDLGEARFDSPPHDHLRLAGKRWGWHDASVRLRGPGARRVWEIFRDRWTATLALPSKHYLAAPTRRMLLNPADPLPAPGPAPGAASQPAGGVSVRVLRSTHGRHRQIFHTLVTAIAAARQYIYIEDQYLAESAGGDTAFELFPHLKAAALRHVKVILVGSGTRDPGDPGVHLRPINRELNRNLRNELIDPLPDSCRANVAVYRLADCTVHAKVVVIDDAFANIGSANMFSRSMVGTDSELSAAVATRTSLVRDLRIALWAEHLRAPLTDELRAALTDVDLALGVWRPEWLPSGVDSATWRSPGRPVGFRPSEQALVAVGADQNDSVAAATVSNIGRTSLSRVIAKIRSIRG